MESINEVRELLTRIIDMMEQQFGNTCEIVLHDHSLDFNNSIVDIRNGYITGRKIGDSGSNLGLEILRSTNGGSDQYNYITYTNNGKMLRSSSIHFKNSNNKLIGSLCVNLDITDSLHLEKFLKDYNGFTPTPEFEGEIFVSDVHEILHELLKRALKKVNKPIAKMTKQDKIDVIKFLDNKGAFLITKSSQLVWETLEISKYTFYKYLEECSFSEDDTHELDK